MREQPGSRPLLLWAMPIIVIACGMVCLVLAVVKHKGYLRDFLSTEGVIVSILMAEFMVAVLALVVFLHYRSSTRSKQPQPPISAKPVKKTKPSHAE
ncbi:hypothetical protein Pelo_12826 [Pelomyxa schiedti]|nr:hypothetical protein Pelo_12826 [Pelomyxa schiedti]